MSGANRKDDVREMTTAFLSGANRKDDVREMRQRVCQVPTGKMT